MRPLSLPFAILLLGWLAVFAPATAATVDYAAVVDRIDTAANQAVAEYDPAAGADTSDRFSDLYFDVFEGSGMEAAVGSENPGRKSELESRFGAVIGLAGRGAPPAEVAAAWQDLRALLRQTARERAQAADGAFAAFLQAFLILLREGFEAILVVGALAAYLRRLGAEDKLRIVWGGVGAALVASLGVAWLFNSVIKLTGQNQEAVEGATLLVASAVLVYVSHWLFAKREAARWQGYVKSRIEGALSGGHVLSLGLAAFLAVFREGAETVLFYQALIAGSPGHKVPVFGGFVVGAVALAVVYALMKRAAVRLPLGLFFGATAVLLYALAVSFAGTGILELQEARWVSSTPLAGMPTVPWLGLYPTVESLAAQGLLLALLVPAVGLWAARRRAARSVP